MTNRHRVPTVFSIYMLDVICCALGCVILLWQLKHDEAEQQTEAARVAELAAKQAQARWKLASTQVTSVTAEVEALRAALLESRHQHDLLSADLVRTEKERDQAGKDRDEAKRLVALRKKEYDELRQAYLLSEALLKGVRADLARLEAEHKLTATDLAAKVKANAELLLKVSAAETRAGDLKKQVAAKQLDITEAARRLEEQLAKLQSAEEKTRSLQKQAAALEADGKDVRTKLTTAELRVKVLEQELDRNKKDATAGGLQVQELLRNQEALGKQLAGAKQTIATLQGEKAAIQAEAERRFAGIALTGQNVLFLVDMSGSMAMTDENTFDPDKWPLVCETVVQLMQSIKGLAYYQVLLFSDKVRYPMGSPATWLRYDPKETPKKALTALKATKPEGETNMHAVFAEAFRYREAELDTIYLLSDGLPNAADRVPPGFDKYSAVQQTEYLSKDLRAKLKNEWNRPLAKQKRVRINSIGFFFESPDVGAFLWALSREHQGSFVGMSK